ncbi:MAG: hypothetical protein ACM3SS_02010 [Rhodospirillaceae bacterium]
MTALLRTVLAIASAGCIAGCATSSSTAPGAVAPSLPSKLIEPSRIESAVSIGKSTKRDVAAALGETLVIRFDTGYEVWVYRLAGDTPARTSSGQHPVRRGSDRSATEFVLLFAPSGLVVKTRIRPAPKPST